MEASLLKGNTLKLSYFKSIIFQILCALNYLEKNGVYLTYLNPSWIMVNLKTQHIMMKMFPMQVCFPISETFNPKKMTYYPPELLLNNDLFNEFNDEYYNTCKEDKDSYKENEFDMLLKNRNDYSISHKKILSNYNKSKLAVWSFGKILIDLLVSKSIFRNSDILFNYSSSTKFNKDYLDILIKYNDSKIIQSKEMRQYKINEGIQNTENKDKNDNSNKIDFKSYEEKQLLEYYFNGYFLNKESLFENLDEKTLYKELNNFDSLLSSCLNLDINKRKSVGELLQSEFFSDIRNNFTEFNYSVAPYSVGDSILKNVYDNDKIRKEVDYYSGFSYGVFTDIFDINLFEYLCVMNMLNNNISNKESSLTMLIGSESDINEVVINNNKVNRNNKNTKYKLLLSETIIEDLVRMIANNKYNINLISERTISIDLDADSIGLNNSVLKENRKTNFSENSTLYSIVPSIQKNNLINNKTLKNLEKVLDAIIEKHVNYSKVLEYKTRYDIKKTLFKCIVNLEYLKNLVAFKIKSSDYYQDFKLSKLKILNTNRKFSYMFLLDAYHLSDLDVTINNETEITSSIHNQIINNINYINNKINTETNTTTNSSSIIEVFENIICSNTSNNSNKKQTSLKENEFNKFYLEELNQITKDALRCKDYHIIFRSFQGQHHLIELFKSILILDKDFFYIQGMESIASAFIYLFSPNMTQARNCMMKFSKKYYSNFIDAKSKSLKSLDFFHIILMRLLAFFDPELFAYLEKIEMYDEQQYFTSWIITFFSRSFDYNEVFLIWDVIFHEKINFIYLIIISMLINARMHIFQSSRELMLTEIIPNISKYVNIKKVVYYACEISRIPMQSSLILSSEFDVEIVDELKKNPFYAERWWMFVDFDSSKYVLPIIYLEDLNSKLDNVVFIDVRSPQEFSLLNISESFNFHLTDKVKEMKDLSKKNLSVIEALRKLTNSGFENKDNKDIRDKKVKKNNNEFCFLFDKIVLFVIVGSRSSQYYEIDYLLHNEGFRFMCILKGGIDQIYIDKPELLGK